MEQNIIPVRIDQGSQDVIESLLDGFWENYNAFKDGRMSRDAEETYKILGAPGPSQYEAFFNFFEFLETDAERLIQENQSHIYMYDLAKMKLSVEPSMVAFIDNLASRNSQYLDAGDPVRLAFGSFWGGHLPARKKIISGLISLLQKGADVQVFAEAQPDERYIANSTFLPVKEKSRFGLKNRISIHFIRAKDLIFFEFPHTETTILRLNMCLDTNDLKFKAGKTKTDLLCFFDDLIKEAVNS